MVADNMAEAYSKYFYSEDILRPQIQPGCQFYHMLTGGGPEPNIGATRMQSQFCPVKTRVKMTTTLN